MGKARVYYSMKNIAFGWLYNVVALLLQFVSRTVFIYTLGVAYLGVNGLFTNVLGTLSLAELGIGTAMNYSLYKPVAEGDREKIKSLLHVYKIAYRTVCLIIFLLGIALLPFLKIIIKDAGNIGNLKVYYLIFLYNSCITYLVSYKFSLVNAEQKNYRLSNINLITNVVTVSVQIIVLLVYRNFLLYLVAASFIGTVQKIFINQYLNKKYPYLLEKNVKKLEKEEENKIKNNIKALILHKIGETSVYQTDNIIISSFISVTMVGMVSNYTLIINTINNFIGTAFNMVTSSFGNLIATESKEKQYAIFKVYRLIGVWFFGFVSMAVYALVSPFIQLWIGEAMVLPQTIILLLTADYYFKGQRICINNMKTAGGVFAQDKYLGMAQGVVNLIVSIIGVKLVGLHGVYIGTLTQGLMANILRPIIVYRSMFDKSPLCYFKDAGGYLAVVALAWYVCAMLSKLLFCKGVTFLSLICGGILICVAPNLLFFLFFRKKEEFKYIQNLITLRKKGEEK